MSSFHWSTMIFHFVIAWKIVGLLSFTNHFGGNLVPASPSYLVASLLLPSTTWSSSVPLAYSHLYLIRWDLAVLRPSSKLPPPESYCCKSISISFCRSFNGPLSHLLLPSHYKDRLFWMKHKLVCIRYDKSLSPVTPYLYSSVLIHWYVQDPWFGIDRPTRIIFEILGADPNLDPEPLSFASLAQYGQGILWIVRMHWSRRTASCPCQDWKTNGACSSGQSR